MYIHSMLASSRVNGPGNRAVIWFQGCGIAWKKPCNGCWNPDTWYIQSQSGTCCNIEEIIGWLDPIVGSIEGITFSGGEPITQIGGLIHLIRRIKQHYSHLSMGLYTGHTEKELSTGEVVTLANYDLLELTALWKDLKRQLDFAVMGRYNERKTTTELPLISSTNQQLVLLSDRYQLKDFKKQEVEFTVSPEGLIQITGFPVGVNKQLDEELWPKITKT